MIRTIAFDGITLGAGAPPALIVDLSNNHNGSYQRAIKLLDTMKWLGVTAAKLQAYTPDELVALRGDGPAPDPWGAQGWSMHQLYTKAQTPLAWLSQLFGHARMIGLPLFASVFGEESLAACEAAGCPAYKLAAMEFGNRPLRELVEGTGKPVIRSCPTEFAPPWTYPQGLQLYCPPGYPQSALHLANLRRSGYGTTNYDGFSYHGRDPKAPAFAVLAGASVVEVHGQLDDNDRSELEAEVSFTPEELSDALDNIVDAWRALAA
ncbi:MAG: N-acetylneuraminate synthase family protein [Gemmatimonadetes bacterium]|nr:N-acetylneuraminate synthase family protein [Gemmatimonadota bacterium]